MGRPSGGPRKRLLAFLALLLLPACATTRWIRFEAQESPRLRLAGVSRLAVLDFANPYNYPDLDVSLGEMVADRLAADGLYAVVRPDAVRPALVPLRLTPSRFTEPGVILQVGRLLSADALLFGDLQSLQTTRTEETREEEQRIGEREQESVQVGPDGNTRTVVLVMGVYRQLRITTVRWTLQGQIEARVVRAADDTVLWQRQAAGAQKRTAEGTETLGETERLDGVRTAHALAPAPAPRRKRRRKVAGGGALAGDAAWKPDREATAMLLAQAADDLVTDLRPRRVLRERLLAEAAGEGEYARRVREGNRAAAGGDWAAAGSAWLQALTLAPDGPEAHADLGVMREQAGDYVQAREAYLRAAGKLGAPWTGYLSDVERVLGAR